MKSVSLIILILLVFFVCLDCISCSSEQVLNAGFEKKLKDWNVDIWTDGGFVSTGYKDQERKNRILIIESEEVDNDISVWQKIPVTPDTCYALSGKISTENVPAEKAGATIGLYRTFFTQGDLKGTAGWQEVKLYFRTGKNKTSVNICCRLGIFGSLATGTVYFDDITVTKISENSALFKSLAEDNFKSLVLIDNASQPLLPDEKENPLPPLFSPAGIVILLLFILLTGLIIFLLILLKKHVYGFFTDRIGRIFTRKTAEFFFSPFREKLFYSLVIALAFSTIVFWFGCISIFMNNMNEFNFILEDILLPAVIATLIASGIIIFVLLITPYRFFKTVTVVFTTICILLWAEWTIFGIYHFGVLAGNTINWWSKWQLGILDIAIWGIVIALVIILRKSFYKRLRLVSICFISFLLIAIGLQYLSFTGMHKELSFNGRTEYEVDLSKQYDFSTELNVIMIVVDETQSDIFYELLEKEKFSTLFDGFSYYPDAAAGLAYTEGAIPLILTGRYYDNQVSHPEYITDAYRSDSIPKVFADNNFRVELYPRFSTSTILYNTSIMANLKKRTGRFAFENIYPLVDISLFRLSPYFLKGGIYNNNKWLFSFKPEVDPEQFDDSSPDYSYLNDDDHYIIRNMKDEITSSAGLPVFKFIHLFGCHAPFKKDRHGEYVEPESTRYIYSEYMVYKMNLVAKMLQTLKKKGVYDNSIIMIMGDHGSGRGAENNVDTNLINVTFDENSQFIPTEVKGRGVPLFMVKDINAKGPVRIDGTPVDYSKIRDILFPLVRKRMKFDEGNTDRDVNESVTRKYFYYEYHDFNTAYLPMMFEFHINGNSWLDSSWSGPYTIYDRTKKYVLAKELDFGQDGNIPEKDKQNFRTTEYNFDWFTGDRNSSVTIRNISFSDDWLCYIRLYKPEASENRFITVMVNNKKLFSWNIEDQYNDYGAVLANTFVFSASDIRNDTIRIDFHHQGLKESLGIKCIQLYSRVK